MPGWLVAFLLFIATALPAGMVYTYTSPYTGQTYTVVGTGYRGAPGPIAGAGLPLLILAGGVYWGFRRYRRSTQRSPRAGTPGT